MTFAPPSDARPNLPAGSVYILQPWPNYLSGKPHTGVDLYGQTRHKPVATEPGKVIAIKPGSGSQVSRIEIDGEATGTRIIYKHVTARVKVGDIVNTGAVLGDYDASGRDSGWWNGYHLHFEVQTPGGGKENDPIAYLIGLMPDITWHMREAVLKIYQDRAYFPIMNIKDVPWG